MIFFHIENNFNADQMHFQRFEGLETILVTNKNSKEM